MTPKYLVNTCKKLMAVEWHIYYVGIINWVISQATLEDHDPFIISSNL